MAENRSGNGDQGEVDSLRLRVAELEAQQARLKESEARYRSLVERMPGIVYTAALDEASTTLYVSPQVQTYLGFTAADYKSDPDIWRKRLHPEDRARVLEELAKSHASGGPFVSEYRMIARDGRVAWFRDEAIIVRDETCRPLVLQGVMFDITGLKKAEESLREHQRQWDLILQSSLDGINISDGDVRTGKRRLVMCNDAYVRMSGRTREELMACEDLNRFMVSRTPEWTAETKRRILRGEPYSGTASWNRPDGKGNFFEYAARAIVLGDKLRIVGVDRDITERMRTEQALRESEEKYRTVVEAIGEAVAVVREDGVFSFMNAVGARRLGLDRKELVGKKVWDVFPRREADRQMGVIRKVLKNGQRIMDEAWVSVLGRRRWYRTSVTPTRGTGRPRAVLIVTRDTTERKLAEEALRRSEATASALLNGTTARALLVERDGTVVAANRNAASAFGMEVPEMVGMNVLKLSPPELAPERQAVMRECIRTGKPARRLDRREGRWLDAVICPVLDAGGKVWRLSIYANDVTEQREAELALRRSREELQRIIDNTWDIIFEVDLKGRYIFANNAAERVTGYPLKRLLKMSMFELTAPEHHAALRERMRQRLAGLPVEQPFRFQIVRRGGRRVDIEMTTSPILRDGKLASILGIARNVTRRVRAEEALNTARLRLTIAREEERRRMARELHDSVGQKMIAMHMHLSAAMKEALPVLSAGQRRSFQRLSDGCDQLIGEVRGICYGLYPPTLESLGLLASLRQFGRAGQGRVPTAVSGNVGRRRFSREVEIELFRIAQEAVSNALRHGKPKRLWLSLNYREGWITMAITDNGRGFDVARAHGRGLGLNSMRERALSIGGQATLTSRPGRTCVRVRVPARPLARAENDGALHRARRRR